MASAESVLKRGKLVREQYEQHQEEVDLLQQELIDRVLPDLTGQPHPLEQVEHFVQDKGTQSGIGLIGVK